MSPFPFKIILLVAALIFFFLETIKTPSTKFQLGWAGMLCLTAAFFFVK
jgi:hypothetical protein